MHESYRDQHVQTRFVEKEGARVALASDVVQPPAMPSTCENERLCIVCCSETISTAAWPCRHSLLCEACMKEVRLRSGECPVCRATIEGVYQGRFQSEMVELPLQDSPPKLSRWRWMSSWWRSDRWRVHTSPNERPVSRTAWECHRKQALNRTHTSPDERPASRTAWECHRKQALNETHTSPDERPASRAAWECHRTYASNETRASPNERPASRTAWECHRRQ
eukprot:TRINITY_DN1987_c0_g1_i1.p1 TRINITY_DN1987_c0_g1~~TRINITY_DN1987_c0_g1_i1.p1  ORF type:complete len:223 (-),score=13.77 TRINITY_DN1987_c0_g1_i1:395-1063(-)